MVELQTCRDIIVQSCRRNIMKTMFCEIRERERERESGGWSEGERGKGPELRLKRENDNTLLLQMHAF